MRALVLAATSLAVAAATAATRTDQDVPPAAHEIGQPISCVTIRQIGSTRVHDDRTIDFKMNNGVIYRNRLRHNCPGLGFEEAFTYRTSSSQICSTDTITVLQPPGLSKGASCGLGEFQRVESEQ